MASRNSILRIQTGAQLYGEDLTEETKASFRRLRDEERRKSRTTHGFPKECEQPFPAHLVRERTPDFS